MTIIEKFLELLPKHKVNSSDVTETLISNLRLEEMALVHVRAFNFGKGLFDDQVKYLHQLYISGVLSKEQLDISSEVLLNNQGSHQLIMRGFENIHGTGKWSRYKPYVAEQIDLARTQAQQL